MSKFNIVKEIKTMDFEEFREKLMEDLAQDLYENTGAEYSIEATSVNKLQNAGYEGIVIRPDSASISMRKLFIRTIKI